MRTLPDNNHLGDDHEKNNTTRNVGCLGGRRAGHAGDGAMQNGPLNLSFLAAGDIEDALDDRRAGQQETGVPASAVNIKGGGGLIGATHVFSQPADGYTLGMLRVTSFLPTSFGATRRTIEKSLSRWRKSLVIQ